MPGCKSRVVNPSRSIAFLTPKLVWFIVLVNSEKTALTETFGAHPKRFPFDFWFKWLVSSLFHFSALQPAFLRLSKSPDRLIPWMFGPHGRFISQILTSLPDQTSTIFLPEACALFLTFFPEAPSGTCSKACGWLRYLRMAPSLRSVFCIQNKRLSPLSTSLRGFKASRPLSNSDSRLSF